MKKNDTTNVLKDVFKRVIKRFCLYQKVATELYALRIESR
jgi:hypothetical protein